MAQNPALSEAFEQATDFSFREEDITRAGQLVGIDRASNRHEQFTSAHFDVIRNFARSYGDDNPFYGEEGYGASTRWGATIASPMLGIAVNKPLLGDPEPREERFPSFRGIHVFVSGSTWDWYRPVRPGDTLYSFQGVESVEEKRSEFAGRSLFVVRRTVRMNQRAEVVSVTRTLAVHTERRKAPERGKYADVRPAQWSDDELAALDAIYAAERPRGREPRYWEDVEVGEALPPMAKGPFTTTDVIVFHAGGYGFTPYAPCSNRIAHKNRQRIKPFYVKDALGVPDVAQRVHWDSAWAQAIGNPMAYDYGVMRDCWLSHYCTDWMGDDAWLVRQHSEIRKFNYIGDAHVLTGEVTGKRIEEGLRVVDLAMRGTDQRGRVTCPGTAVIALPSREHGLPQPPAAPADIADRARRMMDRHLELEAQLRAERGY